MLQHRVVKRAVMAEIDGEVIRLAKEFMPGIAGDAWNDPRAQVISAAGEGSAAAIALNADLVDEDVKRALTDHRAGHAASSPALPTSSF